MSKDKMDFDEKVQATVSKKCPNCDGKGTVKGKVCDKCNGTGYIPPKDDRK